MARLDLTNCSLQQAICIMAEADTGAFVNDLYTICMASESIDPKSFMGPYTIPMLFDDFEIYGADLERIWTAVCKRNIVMIHLLLRAQQFGFIARKDIHEVANTELCRPSTQPFFDFKQLYVKVKERLPEFDPENRLDVESIDKLFVVDAPQSPAAAAARWWANCLRGTGKSDAALEDNPMASMLMGKLASMKKADSEEQIQKFETELTSLIEVVLSERRPVYHKNRSRFEPKSKKRRIQKKFYKKEYAKYNKSEYAFMPKLPDHRAMITGYWRRPCSFGVDYHPEQILADACAVAGIKCSMLTFPYKTHCRVEQDWAGVANGYGADMEIIYGKVPEKGMRRS